MFWIIAFKQEISFVIGFTVKPSPVLSAHAQQGWKAMVLALLVLQREWFATLFQLTQ